MSRIRTLPRRLLISLLLSVLSTAAIGEQLGCGDDAPCTLGVFPHANYRQMEATYAPLVEDLSLLTGLNFRFGTSSSLPRYGDRLSDGKFQVALVGSPQLLALAHKRGYIPIARRDQDRTFSWLVLNSSPYRQVTDLANARIGHPAENTATYLVTHDLLHRNGLKHSDMDNKQVFGRQQGCVHALVTDLVDACGMASAVVEQVRITYGNDRFRELVISKAYPNAIYVAHKDLPPETVDEIRDYLSSRPGYTTASPSDYLAFEHLLKDQAGSHAH